MPSIQVPTTVNCPKQYTCTLSGSAEVRGDHVATLVLPEHLNGEWKLPGDVSWIGFRTASFLFTSANETYQLRFSTPASTVGDGQLKINYTVGAIYAPAWAVLKAVITATRVVEPCCTVPTCTENTGTSNLCGTSSPSLNDLNPGGVGRGTTWCSGAAHTISGSYPNAFAGLNLCTPISTARPCNWTELEFSFPQSFTLTATNPFACGGTITATVTTSISKAVGIDYVTKAGTVEFSGSGVVPQDVSPWNENYYWSGANNFVVEYTNNIPCSRYRIRLYILFYVRQNAAGTWTNGINITGAVSMTYFLEPIP